MPSRIRALTCEDADGYQIIILNSRHCYEQNKKSAEHEINHATDFLDGIDVNELENIRHSEQELL